MFGHKRVPSREGGVEVVVEELCKRMVKRGYDVLIYNRKGHHVSGCAYDVEKKLDYEGIKIKWVPTIDFRGVAAMTSSLFAACAAALSNCDIVHIHSEGPAFMSFIPHLFGKHVIVTVHGLDYQRTKWGKWARKYILQGEKNAVKYADEIIVLSRNMQQYFLEKYNRNTIYIPNGVGINYAIEPNAILDEFLLKKDDYILYLGRLVPEKGIKYLIEAYKMCRTEKKLVIAGGASDSDEYANLLKKSAKSKNIIFTGFVQGKILRELYSNAYLYVLPSDLEGMPLSLLEAMSYGNCCITSNIFECTNVLGDAGVVFEKGNVSDLREQIQRLIDDKPEVERLRLKAKERVRKSFNWDVVVDDTIELYKKTLEM